MGEPDKAEIEKLTIGLGKVVKGYMDRRGDVPERILEISRALAIVAASALGTSTQGSTAKQRATFLAYLDDALADVADVTDDAPPPLRPH
jgi:hypothetical protein